MLQHDSEELDDDLGARPDENLALTTLLGIGNALEAVVQDTDAHHCEGVLLLWMCTVAGKRAEGEGFGGRGVSKHLMKPNVLSLH